MGIVVTNDESPTLPPEQPHETVALKRPGDETVRIDKRLAESVSLLWALGIETSSCCQGSVDRGVRGHITFASYDDALRLDRALEEFSGLCHAAGLWLTGPRGMANGRGDYLMPFDGSFAIEPRLQDGRATLAVSLTFRAEETESLASMLRCVRSGSIEGFTRVTRVEMRPNGDGSVAIGVPVRS